LRGSGNERPEDDSPRPRRRRWPRIRFRLPVVCLSVAAILLLAASGYLAYLVHNDSVTDAQRSAAVLAGRQEAIALTTLSAKTGASDFNTVLAGSAGDLKQQLSAGKSDFIKTLSGDSVTSTGTVLDAGVVSLKENTSATVLLDVRATVNNKQTGKPQTRIYHWKASLVYSNGDWLVTALEYV
jgi:Mce-associated membrane protein